MSDVPVCANCVYSEERSYMTRPQLTTRGTLPPREINFSACIYIYSDCVTGLIRGKGMSCIESRSSDLRRTDHEMIVTCGPTGRFYSPKSKGEQL